MPGVFNHVLDVVGHGYSLMVDFIHTHTLSAGPRACVHGQNRPLNSNLLQTTSSM